MTTEAKLVVSVDGFELVFEGREREKAVRFKSSATKSLIESAIADAVENFWVLGPGVDDARPSASHLLLLLILSWTFLANCCRRNGALSSAL